MRRFNGDKINVIPCLQAVAVVVRLEESKAPSSSSSSPFPHCTPSPPSQRLWRILIGKESLLAYLTMTNIKHSRRCQTMLLVISNASTDIDDDDATRPTQRLLCE